MDDNRVRWTLTEEERQRIESTAVEGSNGRHALTVDDLRESRWPPELEGTDIE